MDKTISINYLQELKNNITELETTNKTLAKEFSATENHIKNSIAMDEIMDTITWNIDRITRLKTELKNIENHMLTKEQFYNIILNWQYKKIEVYTSATYPQEPLKGSICNVVYMLVDDISIKKWSMDKGITTLEENKVDYINSNKYNLLTLHYNDGSKTSYKIYK